MARGRGRRPPRMQTRAEMLMPRAAFEALERRRDELWAQGLDPYDPVNLANDEENAGNGNEERFCTFYSTYEDDHD